MFGQLSSDCPSYSEPDCFNPCEHSQDVIDYVMSPVITGDERLTELIKAGLKTQEDYLRHMCEWVMPVCRQGAILGFPCAQCGYIAQQLFDPTCTTITCGSETYEVVDPCRSMCGESCDRCLDTEVDFSTSGESFDLYEKIITALQAFDGGANWSGIEQMAKLIFGDDAEVVTFQGGVYYLSLGREPTDFEIRAWPVIDRVFPLPIGSKIKLVK